MYIEKMKNPKRIKSDADMVFGFISNPDTKRETTSDFGEKWASEVVGLIYAISNLDGTGH